MQLPRLRGRSILAVIDTRQHEDLGNEDIQSGLKALEQVRYLIQGFETPYGMEMLATVHWVAQEDTAAATDPEAAIAGVQSWSDRKRTLLKPQHLRKAWQRLSEQGCLSDDSLLMDRFS